MRRIATIALLFSLATPALAQKPTEASIRELFEVTQIRDVMEKMDRQVEAMARRSMQRAMKGREVTDEQRAILEDMRADMMAAYREEITWEKLEPVYMRIYRDSFTQSEVDAMLEFYRTPEGEAVIEKLPQVMRQSMQYVQQMLRRMMPRLQEIRKKAARRLRAAE